MFGFSGDSAHKRVNARVMHHGEAWLQALRQVQDRISQEAHATVMIECLKDMGLLDSALALLMVKEIEKSARKRAGGHAGRWI